MDIQDQPVSFQAIREPLSVIAESSTRIFNPQKVYLPNVCVYENTHEFSKEFARHLLRDIYISRMVEFPAIDLVKLPPDTVVHGDHQYVTTIGDVFLEEQFHPVWHTQKAFSIINSQTPEILIDEECLLLSRYGAWTWGHWLGELIPRAVVAELIAPKKYKFVIPDGFGKIVSQNFLDALYAYGIEESRLIRIDQNHRYRFSRLSTVSSMWVYPYAMQPVALDLMQNRLQASLPDTTNAKAIAVLRPRGGSRYIENYDEIESLLRIKKFFVCQIGKLPFLEQIALFSQAEYVFGELGSNLTGLIYSPLGVKTISVAPGDWGDCFFHGLIQNRGGKYADVRGTPNPLAKTKNVASFTLSIVRMTEALEAIGYDENPKK
jgi:hypothetical protein